MKTSSLAPLAALCALLLGATPRLHAQTDVRPTPGGKRLLFVDGDDIRPEPGGKRLLFVDGSDIRPEPGGKRLLLVDSDGDVRQTPGGIRLAVWDGNTLRRSPGGSILLVVDGTDIRPTAGGPRMYFLDGPKLSLPTLTAVLYSLKPDLFTLSAAETAARQKEMADNGAAEEAAAASADPWTGDHMIAGQSTADTTKRTGSIVIAKQGGYYKVTYQTGDTPPWQGIGVAVKPIPGADPELWAAVGPGGAAALGVYEIKSGSLTGSWFPVNATTADPAVLGFENLAGPTPALGGAYQITGGKLPNNGVAYTGSLNIEPLPATFSGTAKCYRLRWTTGATAIGFVGKDRLAVAAGWGADCEVLRFRLDHSSMSVDLLNKSGAQGDYTILK